MIVLALFEQMVKEQVAGLVENQNFFWEEAPLQKNGDPAKGVWLVTRSGSLRTSNKGLNMRATVDFYVAMPNKVQTEFVHQQIRKWLTERLYFCELKGEVGGVGYSFTNVRIRPSRTPDNVGATPNGVIVKVASAEVVYDETKGKESDDGGGGFIIPTERTESPYGVVHLLDWDTGDIRPYYLTNNGGKTLMSLNNMQNRFATLEYANGSETATVEVSANNLVGVDIGSVISTKLTAPSFLQYSTNLRWFSFSPQCQITTIGPSFLSNCFVLDAPIVVPESVTTIQQGFLSSCRELNQPVTLPSGLLEIGNSFLSGCINFNQPLVLPQSLGKIGSNFLSSCSSFNQPLTLPEVVIDMSYFLANAKNFNSPIDMSNTTQTSVTPRDFMQSCSSFNESLMLPKIGLVKIGVNFMSDCSSFNQDVRLPDTVTALGNSFMADNDSFVATIDLNNVEQVGSSFAQCSSKTTKFNGVILAPKLKTIGNQFLYGCLNYNREINLPAIENIGSNFLRPGAGNANRVFNSKVELGGNLTTIGDSFMSYLYSFNQPFRIPDKLASIPPGFMDSAQSFDQPFVIPASVKNIGSIFGYRWSAYSHKIAIPETVQSIGASPFWYSGVNLTELEVNCPPPTDTNNPQLVLSTTQEDAPSYINGIKISGQYAEQWIAKYPNRTISPYRNLVLAKSEGGETHE